MTTSTKRNRSEILTKRSKFNEFVKSNPVLSELDNLLRFNKPVSNSAFTPTRNDYALVVPAEINLQELEKNAIIANVPFVKVIKLLSLIATKTVADYKPESPYKGSKKKDPEESVKTNKQQTSKYPPIKDLQLVSKRFTDITSKETKRLFQNDFNKVYFFLSERSILTRKPYAKGQCFSYGYHPSHRFRKLKIGVVTVPKLAQAVRPYFKTPSTEKYSSALIKVFKKERFGIDLSLIEKTLFSKYCSDFNFNIDGSFQLDDNFNSQVKYSAYHSALVKLAKFLNGEFYFNRTSGLDAKTTKLIGRKKNSRIPKGRFYSSFSGLNKEIRNLLKYEQENLVQIDVKNCVAFTLSNMLLSNPTAFSGDMIKTLTSNNLYSNFCLQFCEQALLSRGIELEVTSAKDIMKPLEQLELCINVPQRFNFSVSPRPSRFSIECNDTQQVLQHDVPTLPHPLNFREDKPTETLLKQSERISSTMTSLKDWLSSIKSDSASAPLKIKVKSYEQPENSNKTQSNKEQPLPSFAYFILSIHIFQENLETLMQKELRRFQELAEGGEFYEYFIPCYKNKFTSNQWRDMYSYLFNDSYNGSVENDRKITKFMLTAMLNARNGKSYRLIKEVFISHFPYTYLLIHELKMGNHKGFAHTIISTEAKIVLDDAAKTLLKKRIPCLTIHDCIAVKHSDVSVAREILTQAFINHFGIAPKIEIE